MKLSSTLARIAVRILCSHDSVKMLRETLCVAQARIGNSPLDADRRPEHIDRLQRLIDECDRMRPLVNGRHVHCTKLCGCR